MKEDVTSNNIVFFFFISNEIIENSFKKFEYEKDFFLFYF